MSFKRKVFVSAIALFSLAGLAVCLLAVACCIIPLVFQSRLVPEMARKIGVQAITCKVGRIGFRETTFGPIAAGLTAQPAISADSIRLSYTPSSLFRGRIDRITVSGMKIHARLHNGRISLPGIRGDETPGPGEQGKISPTKASLPSLPLTFDELLIEDALLVIGKGGNRLRFPFDIRVVPEQPGFRAMAVEVAGYPFGSRINASGRIDLAGSSAEAEFRGRMLELAQVAAALPPVPDLTVSGRADIEGNILIDLAPFEIKTFSAVARCRRTRIDHPGVSLVNLSSPEGSEIPIRLAVNKTGGGEWAVAVSPISIPLPVPVRLEEMNCRMAVGRGALETTGTFSMVLPAFSRNHPFPVQSGHPLASDGRFNASWVAPDRWQFTLGFKQGQAAGSRPAGPWTARIGGADLSARQPELTVSGSGTQRAGDFRFRLDLPEFDAREGSSVVHTARISLEGSSRMDRSKGPLMLTADFTTRVSGIKLAMAAAKGDIADAAADGRILVEGGTVKRAEALAKFSGATFSDDGMGLRVEGIRGQLPLHWPPEGGGRNGMLSASGLKWKRHALGSVAAVIRQEGPAIAFSGTHVSEVLPELKLLFSGSTGMDSTGKGRTAVDFKISDYRPPGGIDLGAYIAGAQGVRATGMMNAAGRAILGSGPVRCMVDASVTGGALFSDADGFAVEGVKLSISLPDLLALRSTAGQQLTFETARLGDLTADGGSVTFRIDPPGTLFIEKGSFLWCGGHMDIHALRISPDRKEYRTVLYCDRLLLSEILEQLGAAQAEGGGTLNGKIPLHIQSGDLSFDNGFLYSTPGEEGTIRLSNTEILTAGIPRDLPQYAQLDLAREALKDYTYRWVKLGLNTEKETLLLKMQMDGKPAKPLPFEYDPKTGGFIRAGQGSKGSIFQGISLDVNFRLPLNKILAYRNIWGDID